MSESEWTVWDNQIEEDLKAGRLDKLLKEVEDAHNQGLTLPVCEGKRVFDRIHSSTHRNDE